MKVSSSMFWKMSYQINFSLYQEHKEVQSPPVQGRTSKCVEFLQVSETPNLNDDIYTRSAEYSAFLIVFEPYNRSDDA